MHASPHNSKKGSAMIATTETKRTSTDREYLVRAWIRTSRPIIRRLLADLRTARADWMRAEFAVQCGDKAMKKRANECRAIVKGLEKEIRAGRKGKRLAAQGLLAALQAGVGVTKGERSYLWAIVKGLAVAQGLEEGQALSLMSKAA